MPAEHRLVGEHALELRALAAQQGRRGRPARPRSASGPRRAMPGHLQRVAHQVDGQPLLGAGLGQVEAAERPGPLRRSPGSAPGAAGTPAARGPGLGGAGESLSRHCSQPPRDRWVIRCRPSTSRSRNLPYRLAPVTLSAVQRGQRRVEGLDRAERGHVGAHHDASGRALAQERGQRLDFRQFRHGFRVIGRCDNGAG